MLLALPTMAFVLVLQTRAQPSASGGSPAERALEHVRSHPAATFSARDDAFTVRAAVVDRGGAEHVHLDRLYRGVPVLGGDLVVHSGADGEFRGVSQTLRARPALALEPLLSRQEAVDRARPRLPAGVLRGRPRLMIDALAAPRLAYDVVLVGTRPDGTPSELHVLVDARDGPILHEYDEVETAVGNGFFNGRVSLRTATATKGYRLTDPTRGNAATLDMRNRRNGGSVVASPTDAWGDGKFANRETVAVDVQFGVAATWDYFLRSFGRRGLADDGIGSSSRVHFGRNFANAFWLDSCFCATFGDGNGAIRPLAALDVVAHELTHGLTTATANFVGEGEAGGLDESTSDIFGTMVEFTAATPSRPADYRIGERLFARNPGNRLAIRYMWRPSLDWGSPDCWSTKVASLDRHAAAGIGNHFFYLLAEGSQPATGPRSPICGGQPVDGIGREDAARIWYRALTVYLTSAADYHAARAATLQASGDLFGADAPQTAVVAAAWTAVGVTPA